MSVTKKDIVKYCSKTPDNTNLNFVSNMLDNIEKEEPTELLNTIKKFIDRSSTSILNTDIPSNLTSIGPHAFAGFGSLISIDLSNLVNLATVRQWAFSSGNNSMEGGYATSRISSIIFPKETTSWSRGIQFDRNCFEGLTQLTNLDLTCATNIGTQCFKDSGLTTLYLSNKMQGFSWCAFDGANSLTDIYYTGTQEQWNNIGNVLNNNCGIPQNCTIHYNYTPTEQGGLE